MKAMGLCWRCEHRATFHDVGFASRYECGQTDKAVGSCYMYRPTKPLVIAPDKGDRRPLSPAMIAARCHAVGVAEGEYVTSKGQGGVLVWYEVAGRYDGRAAAPGGNGADGYDGAAPVAGRR